MAGKAATVWMVHALTNKQGAKGELVVGNEAVVFRPAEPGVGEHTFRFDQIRKVRRAWGSPVIELILRIPQGLPAVAFYFVKPPNLEPSATARFPFKWRVRRQAATQLAFGDSAKHKEVDRWAELIRQSIER